MLDPLALGPLSLSSEKRKSQERGHLARFPNHAGKMPTLL